MPKTVIPTGAKHSGAARISPIAPARIAAAEILLQIATSDAHSDELLRSEEVNTLTPQDRALTTTLVLGTLRWQLAIDQQIRPFLKRPEAGLAPAVETTLRLGAFQLLCLDRIPAHAAINESVELTRQAGETYAAGMVNAILRKLAAKPKTKVDPKQAHPEWLVKRWLRNYGPELTQAICAANQEPVPITLRVLHPNAEQLLKEEGIQLQPGAFLTVARKVVQGDVLRSTAFRKGWVKIQDEGSQLIAELAGHGQNILDTCAAPGGKTAILSERNPEAGIQANDASKKRLEAMRRTLGAKPMEYAVQDATKMQLKPQYDLILCDVPCTGTGTLSRNPEIRFRLNEEEIQRQQKRQKIILANALEGLTPGGKLLYSTCSLEPEENEAVVEAVLQQKTSFQRISLEREAERLKAEGILQPEGMDRLQAQVLKEGRLRTIPGLNSCDGFYAELLVRK